MNQHQPAVNDKEAEKGQTVVNLRLPLALAAEVDHTLLAIRFTRRKRLTRSQLVSAIIAAAIASQLDLAAATNRHEIADTLKAIWNRRDRK